MAIIAFPSILNERLTDAGAQALVDVFDKIGQENQKTTLGITEERFEKRMTQLDAKIDGVASRLDAKIDGVESRLDAKIDGVESRLEMQIVSVKSELEVKIERSQANIIKWMFIFWIGQVGTMMAILFTFLKT